MDGALFKLYVIQLGVYVCLGGQQQIVRVDEGCKWCAGVFDLLRYAV